VELREENRSCDGCGASHQHVTLNGKFTRQFRALPVGTRAQYVVLHGHEQTCQKCGRTLREPIRFSEGKRRYIKRFETYVIDLCRFATIKHVSLLLGVSWAIVKGIYKRNLRKRYQRVPLRGVRRVAIDEFAIRKGHDYMTVILDLDARRIIHASEGRRIDSVVPFLQRLRKAGANLEAVAIDMWEPYIQAVEEVFPEAAIVHDRYHVVSMANRAVDETRREIYKEQEGKERKVLKGSRFLLLKGGEKLNESAQDHLERLKNLNEPLFEAYLLKEELRGLWRSRNLKEGEDFLDSWIKRAKATGLKQFIKLGESLKRHRDRLLSYFNHRISTGPLEGLNNKIKVLKRQAYGFRDMEYFRLRLAFIHEGVPAYPG
jgi:transposase